MIVPLQYTDNERYQHASNLLASSRYYDALIQLKILRTLYPADDTLQAEIARLEKAINQAADAELTLVTSDYAPEEQKKRLLKVLSLNPNNQRAFEMLQALVLEEEIASFEEKERIARAVQRKRPKSAPLIAPQTTFEESLAQLANDEDYLRIYKLTSGAESEGQFDGSIREYRAKACAALADETYAEGNIDQSIGFYECALAASPNDSLANKLNDIKSSRSDSFYKEGMRLFKVDVRSAIDMFEKSLRYNPDNLLAKKRLGMAKVIYQNLKAIEQTN